MRAYHDIVQSFSSPMQLLQTPTTLTLLPRSDLSSNQTTEDKLPPLTPVRRDSIPRTVLSNLQRPDGVRTSKVVPNNSFNMDMEEEPYLIKIPDTFLERKKNQKVIDLTHDNSNAAQTIQFVGDTLDEVVICNSYAEISRRTLSILDGREWLNDQIINFYMHMLQERDRILSREASANTDRPIRLRSWFSTTFFWAKLLENGEYNYNAVRRWTRSDIININTTDKVIIPINVNNNHWTLLVFYMFLKELHYYDSNNGNGSSYLQYGLRWLSDECMDKTQIVLNTAEWRCFHKEAGVPQQDNGYDCGVFVLMCARAISYNQPLNSYHQDDMPRYRLMIGRHILRGSLLDSNDQSLPYMIDLPPLQTQGTGNINNDINNCTEEQSKRQTILEKSRLKSSTIKAATHMVERDYCKNGNESVDSDDSEETLQAIYSNISVDSDESNGYTTGNNNSGRMEVILNKPTSAEAITPTYYKKTNSRRMIDNENKRDVKIALDAASNDQSDYCESESNYCMGITDDCVQSLRLKNAAAQKRSYWKKKHKKTDYYKHGLLSYNDSDLQSISDGIQFRHR